MLPTLHGVHIFAGLTDEALTLLLQRSEEQTFEPESVIVREGETGNRMFVIATGSVRICKHFGTENQLELATLGTEDFFGEMCILDNFPRAATVQATARTTVVSIPASAFHHLYKQQPAQYSVLLLNIARDLSRRLRHLDEAFASRH